jgi:hypothetical protein
MTEEKEEKVETERLGRSQRKLRNYLIDKRFQMKYTLMIAALSTVLVVILGVPLYKTVSDASDQLAACVLSDETYASDAQVSLLKKSLESEKRKTVFVLTGFLALLLVGLALSGIYITHKVAGPMYKIRKLISAVDGNNLVMEGRLRKGDELLELFQSFDDMVTRLREHEQSEARLLGELIAKLKDAPEKGTMKDVIASLEKMHDKMQMSLK